MSFDITSLVEMFGAKNTLHSTDVEHEANVLVPGEMEGLTGSKVFASHQYSIPTDATWQVVCDLQAGPDNATGSDFDDVAEDTLTADLSIDELVQQRERLA